VLILTRKNGEELVIGEHVRVRVLSVTGGRVRLAIEAPREVSVRRAELGFVPMQAHRALVENECA